MRSKLITQIILRSISLISQKSIIIASYCCVDMKTFELYLASK